jgi:hypothetical protein
MANKTFTTPVGVANYPYISKPDTQFDAEGVYKVTLAVPEDEAKPVIELINAELLAGVKALKESKPKTKFKSAPLPYAKELDDDGNETGNVLIKFKSKAAYKPSVFDAKNNPMINHNIWGGSEIKVNGAIAFYSSPSIGQGVTLRLRAVQVIQYVEGSDGAGKFNFEEEDGYVTTSSSEEESEAPEQVDVSVNVPAAQAEESKPVAKSKPAAKPVPIEEPEDIPVASSDDDLAAEIAKLVGE